MVLGEVIAVESGSVIGFDQIEPAGVELGERAARIVHVVEHAELHDRFSGRRSACSTDSVCSLPRKLGRGRWGTTARNSTSDKGYHSVSFSLPLAGRLAPLDLL